MPEKLESRQIFMTEKPKEVQKLWDLGFRETLNPKTG